MWRQHHYQGTTRTLTVPILPVKFDTSETYIETYIYVNMHDFLDILQLLQGDTQNADTCSDCCLGFCWFRKGVFFKRP